MRSLLLSLCIALTASAQPASFDVASVKPHSGSAPADSNFPLGPGNAYTPNGGYFNASGFPAMTYIAFAYKLLPPQSAPLIRSAPSWITTELYDIQARVPE